MCVSLSVCVLGRESVRESVLALEKVLESVCMFLLRDKKTCV